jgi:NADH dehydrogenase
MSTCLVTGANGHLGRRLIPVLAANSDVVALVRSARARDTLLRHIGGLERVRVTVADPASADDVARVAAGCEHAVHLIGTIRATRTNSLRATHEIPAAALVAAMRSVPIRHVVYVSILGADAGSASACLRARAAVEAMFADAPPVATTIRVPMVLGERDRASYALAKRAAAARAVVFRATSLEQPIYAGDVIAALAQTLAVAPAHDRVFDLAGPRSLSRRELITAAGRAIGRRTSVVSLPLFCGMALAAVFEATRANPPLTRDMLRILDHDDAIDPAAAAAALGITLTPLDEMLERCIVGRLAQPVTT